MKIIRCNLCKVELGTNESYLTVSVKTGEPEKFKGQPVTSNGHVCVRCAPRFCREFSIPTLVPGARKPQSVEEE